MRALRYFVVEAAASLWRGRRAAALAVGTTVAGFFVLGFFLLLQVNLERVVARWSEAAELSVYLRDDITAEEQAGIERLLQEHPVVLRLEAISKEDAVARFRANFRDLAAFADTLEHSPFPASYEVRLRPEAGRGPELDRLGARLRALAGVADVRYDRLWLERLLLVVGLVRAIGLVIVTIVGVATALTVANVVRLAAYARRDEIEIMQLVGAPAAYVRGPFVMEGLLQGGLGAAAALLLLRAGFGWAEARYGSLVAGAIGLDAIAFLPGGLTALVLAGGMAVGCLGGVVASRSVREPRPAPPTQPTR